MPFVVKKISSLNARSIAMCENKFWRLVDNHTIKEYDISIPGDFIPWFNRDIVTPIDVEEEVQYTISGLCSVSGNTFITISKIPNVGSRMFSYYNITSSPGSLTTIQNLALPRNIYDLMYVDQGDKYLIYTSGDYQTNKQYITQLNLSTLYYDAQYELPIIPSSIYQSAGGTSGGYMYCVDRDTTDLYTINFSDGSLTSFGDSYINYNLSATTDTAQQENNDCNVTNCVTGYFTPLAVTGNVYSYWINISGDCSPCTLTFSDFSGFTSGTSLYYDSYLTTPITQTTAAYSGNNYSISGGVVQNITTSCPITGVGSCSITAFTGNYDIVNNLGTEVIITGKNACCVNAFILIVPPQTILNYCSYNLAGDSEPIPITATTQSCP
jgi:hypothetical protein